MSRKQWKPTPVRDASRQMVADYLFEQTAVGHRLIPSAVKLIEDYRTGVLDLSIHAAMYPAQARFQQSAVPSVQTVLRWFREAYPDHKAALRSRALNLMRDLSKEQVAEAMGISLHTLNQWIRHESRTDTGGAPP